MSQNARFPLGFPSNTNTKEVHHFDTNPVGLPLKQPEKDRKTASRLSDEDYLALLVVAHIADATSAIQLPAPCAMVKTLVGAGCGSLN